ncbi:helix-turn-helix transcriptional regulator [Akkermansia glycaniphila]|uniref:helix-turn-helix domain-containing protein n=1 Tax=Akkermansia glycaniphila TaxID=1679444 RepID=UPI001C0248D1|nr:helix-turn-helix transcriptional regulator [Akkermansia glycaniphila]MBT9449386.1 helix-turn-helix transcriptional regulator [Akkermansia glycaniphila]
MKKGQNIIGAQVRKRRNQLHLSQNRFATSCQLNGWQLSRETLSKIEAGLRCVTDAETLFLSQMLSCPVNYLMEGAQHDNILQAMRHSRDTGDETAEHPEQYA